jgi:hypothetical protein
MALQLSHIKAFNKRVLGLCQTANRPSSVYKKKPSKTIAKPQAGHIQAFLSETKGLHKAFFGTASLWGR